MWQWSVFEQVAQLVAVGQREDLLTARSMGWSWKPNTSLLITGRKRQIESCAHSTSVESSRRRTVARTYPGWLRRPSTVHPDAISVAWC
jgi:hypothetical protein